MSEALLIWVAAGIILFVGCVNIALTIYTGVLFKGIRNLLKSSIYLNTEAIDLLRYGLSRGYEQGREDTLKKVVREETNHE